MKVTSPFLVILTLLSLIITACGAPTPTVSAAQPEAPVNTQPPAATATPPATEVPQMLATPTVPTLELEVLQSQVWTDPDGNLRINVLLRNPYDFPVQPDFRARAGLLDAAGEFIRDVQLYFLDGISGGHGFLMPGETVAANGCFTCEREALTQEWSSIRFRFNLEDATDSWQTYTDVEATAGSVSFNGTSPIFDVSGTVKNNSDEALNRISARIFVYDGEGNLVGAAEASAWDVPAGGSMSFKGLGIGQKPEGPLTYEVTALGVKY